MQLAELAVLIGPTARELTSALVLAPEQLQRHAYPAEVAMDPLKVDRGTSRRLAASDVRELRASTSFR